MLIKMNATRRGSEDGFAIRCFEKGVVYNVADSLAHYFIHHGLADRQEIIDGCNNPQWYSVFHNDNKSNN